jgi:hypothetical protein
MGEGKSTCISHNQAVWVNPKVAQVFSASLNHPSLRVCAENVATYECSFD